MTSEEIAKKLHLKNALGEKLTTEEQEILNEWYSKQDAEEWETLNKSSLTSNHSISDIQTKIKATLTQLAEAIKRIQQLTAENEKIRKENTSLKKQLIGQLKKQAV